VTVQARLKDLADSKGRQGAEAAEDKPLIEKLNETSSYVVGLFVTDLLERNQPYGGLTTQPLLECIRRATFGSGVD
jgi:hypothetical protein